MKKISIIVPAYNVEKYVGRCLESILKQTYKNLEVIVVNDGSTDNTKSIIQEYCEKDDRVRMVNQENKGLYHARIAGVDVATGDYIAFVDSDDYISDDYYRVLIEEAEDKNADVVVGRIVQEDTKGYRWIQNLYVDYKFDKFEGRQIWDEFWKQEGQLFIWHTIWNKIYSAEIWKKSLPILKKQTKHLIMCEDFVFSSVLFNFVKTISSVKYGEYYYYRNDEASTSLKGGAKKFTKNIGDLITSFKFIREFFEEVEQRDEYRKHFDRWESLYHYFWINNVLNSDMDDSEKSEFIDLLNLNLCDGDTPRNPNYFYQVATKYDDRYESLVKMICSDETEVVSFDIFDTLLVRPFYQPSDLFEFMNKSFEDKCGSFGMDFSYIRKEAERLVRDRLIYAEDACKEEVSIDDIYDEIKKLIPIKSSDLEYLKELEIELEEKFLYKRESVYNLFKLARFLNKKIAIVSDMYIGKEDLQRILHKNGYTGYDKLFVSCDEEKTKRTGTLFGKVLDYYDIDPIKMVHIGDSWDSDVERARECGIKTFFYPKPIECIMYSISDIKTGHALGGLKGRINSWINFEKIKNYSGTKSAIAVVANSVYDMPFVSYDEWSEGNASPQFAGYFYLGLHLLGFTKWLMDDAGKLDYSKLVFIARDGYLPMKAVECFNKYGISDVETDYFYTSRKAAIECVIEKETDFYSLFSQIVQKDTSKRAIVSYFKDILEIDDKEIEDLQFDEVVESFEDYSKFVKDFLSKRFSEDKAKKYREKVKEYFVNTFSDNSALIDIGYSARTQEMIYKISGKAVDGYYVHENGEESKKRQRKYGFNIKSFYDFSPAITGSQRELLFSKLAPSCIRYEIDGESVRPVFEDYKIDYPYYYLITELQHSALDFVEKYCEKFADYFEIMDMRNVEISLPFEHYLSYLEDDDLKMFSCIRFEDDLWAGGTVKLSDQWRGFINYHKLRPEYKPEIQVQVEKEYVKEYVDRYVPVEKDDYVWDVYNQKDMKSKALYKKIMFWLLLDKAFLKQRIKDSVRRNK